ncbi:response regulator [Paraburkholderia caballeronis]|uniref:response regulator n=1 Tax=Paraburkholderia caballeronis TaxID=416943 RepID=UPI001416F16C|nr:response regulator transcription factor [Paraburkholderia caballeronis]
MVKIPPAKPTLLIIDDHPLFREALCPLLHGLMPDAHIVGVGDVQSALEVAMASVVRLVLIDYALPRMNGIAAIPLLRQLLPSTPIAMVSASEQASDAKAAIAAGARGFVPKSLRPQELQNALRQVLDGGCYIPASMLEAFAGLASASADANGREDEHGFTLRQRQVLQGLCEGLSNKEIAQRLDLAENTVKVHVTAIFKVLGVVSRTQAVVQARQFGISGAR